MPPRKKPINGKRQQRKVPVKPWQPDSKQMEWFRLWTEDGLNCAEIARRAKPVVTRTAVLLSVKKTEEWFRLENYDSTVRFKGRHTVTLEKIVMLALEGYKRTVGLHKVVTTKTTKGGEPDPDDYDSEPEGAETETTVKAEELAGTVAFLAEARAAMKEIRAIWGVDSPIKSAVEITNPNEVEGLPPQNSFNSRAEAYAAIAEIMKERAARLEAGIPENPVVVP